MNKFYKGYDSITASEPFKQRMVRTLQSETKGETATRSLRLPIKRRTLAILIAAAVLVLAIGTAAAATIIAKNYYSPSSYLMHDKDAREQNQNAVPDIEEAIASAKPETGETHFVMLPEMEDAAELNAWRQKMGQPVYSEEDWGWIREIRPEIEEVLVDESTLVFNVRLNTDHGMRFSYARSGDGQWTDALCDEAYYTVLDTGRTGELNPGTGINPDSVSEDGATLGTECDLDEPFPTEGKVRITMTIGIYDARVDDMAHIGLLANIIYTFEFDASAGADIAAPIVTERALSGSTVLTLIDRNGCEHNERVSLDGVVLEETLSFRKTGVYVTYRIKSAPEEWFKPLYEASMPGAYAATYANAFLVQCSDSGSLPGFLVTCAPKGSTDENEVIIPGKPNSMGPGAYTCILPFFPSDYEQVKAAGYELRLGFRCVTAFNDVPVGEDWVMPEGAGLDGYNLTTTLQTIASFDLKLP